MRLAALSVLLTASLAAPLAAEESTTPHTDACTTTCAACQRAIRAQTPPTVTPAASRPWYIGPKGGDIRKGHTPSPIEVWASVHGNDPAPVADATPPQPKPWYIGPKGGDIRKGHSPSPSELWAIAQANAQPVVSCDHYVAPERGPKGGFIKRSRGESDADVQRRADAACLAVCSH